MKIRLKRLNAAECVNERESKREDDFEEEKGDAIYFQFRPNDVPRKTHKKMREAEKNSLRDQTRESSH